MNATGKKKKRVNVQNTLRLAACSALRKDILISLQKGKKPLSKIRDELGVSSTTAIHALRELERDNLVLQNGERNYALTKIGEILTLKLTDFINTADILKKHEHFWLEHDLSGIPERLVEKIGWLSNATLLVDSPTDILKSHKALIQVLETANEVKGIYPIFNLEYLEKIEELVEGKVIDVELIVSNEVLDSIEGVLETNEAFKNIFSAPNFTLLGADEPIKILFTLTDSILYLGLFAAEGLYDFNRALVCDDERALSWGRELHEYYRQLAKAIVF
jgi:predicted transcriptional regulator